MLAKIADNLRKRVARSDKTDLPSYRSLMWYYSQVKTLKTTYRQSTSSPIVEPGRMFLMGYNPKTAETLEYYDVYPVVFVIEYTKNGFLGLNLHYLPLEYRSKLFSALVSIARENNDQDRIKLSYRLIKDFSRSKLAMVCIKRYLSSNITDMIHIPYNNWLEVSALPVENFKKKNKNYVWSESVKKINKVE